MQKHSPLRFFLTLALTAALALLCVCAVSAERGEPVRVGFFTADGYQQLSDGQKTGAGYETLQALAQYAGWEYAYVYASYTECLEMLKNGEIDIMGLPQRTPQLESAVDFADMASGVARLALIARPNGELAAGDYKKFSGLSVGFLGTAEDGAFARFASDKGFDYTQKHFDDVSLMLEALNNQEIDAAAISGLFSAPGQSVLAFYGHSPYYYAVSKQSGLIDTLNQAVEGLWLDSPDFFAQLERKYTPQSQPALFSAAQLSYINLTETVRVAYPAGSQPFIYKNEAGEIDGIMRGCFDELAALTGLSFEYVEAPDYNQALALVDSGEAELIAFTAHDYDWARQRGLKLCRPLYDLESVFLSANDGEGRALALPRGAYIVNFADTARASFSAVRYYSTFNDCVTALLNGEAGTALVYSYTADYYLSDPRLSGYSIVSAGVEPQLTIGVGQNASARLLEVLNKAIQAIERVRLHEIALQNTARPADYSMAQMLAEHPQVSFAAICLLIAGIFWLTASAHHARRANRQLAKLHYEDPLTGFPSYGRFEEVGANLLSARGPSDVYVLLHMNMLRFKYINDTYGYREGDRALIMVSRTLNDFIRPNECFARIYADRFVLLLKSAGKEELEDRLELLKATVSALTDMTARGYSFIFRGGVYTLAPDESSLIAAVDRANYALESLGTIYESSFAFYDESMRSDSAHKKELEKAMHAALQNGEFTAFFQPKVNIETREIVGAEALARWIRPGLGIVPPAEFIPVFEQNGFITSVDLDIFAQVCALQKSIIERGETPVPISSNFSRLHLDSDGFAERITGIAESYEVPPKYLELEFSENIAISSLRRMTEQAKRLHERGFRISVDDFGSGYASVGILQNMPVDTLKLDAALVDAGMKNKMGRELISYLISSAKSLGAQVICEGIENREQETFLQSIDCTLAQGYLYYRPAQSAQFLSSLYSEVSR